jgi:hypothetical protein
VARPGAHYTAEQAETVYRAERHGALVRTSSKIRVRWNRALAKADPEVIRRQAEAAHADREVKVLTRCAAPGAASLLLTGPAPLILAAKQRLDDVADSVRAADPGDRRTLDAIRLDAAVDLLLRGYLSEAEHGGRPGNGRETGPIDPDASRPPGSRESGATLWPNSGRAPARRRPAVVVTIPLSVLTGAGQMPAALAGYGPIPAQMAREVAADAVWRCAVLDDDPTSASHGELLALGRTTYTPNYVPGEQARRFITIRDGTCRFPGCQAQAATGDLDHRTPHSRGGPTCDCNLQALCRHHHRLKHQGGITVKRGGALSGGMTEGADHPDAITWTMPSGRSYTTLPESPPF